MHEILCTVLGIEPGVSSAIECQHNVSSGHSMATMLRHGNDFLALQCHACADGCFHDNMEFCECQVFSVELSDANRLCNVQWPIHMIRMHICANVYILCYTSEVHTYITSMYVCESFLDQKRDVTHIK